MSPSINSEPDRSDRCKANREKQMAEESEGGRRDCMPLTVTFPVFFYAHTLGKALREISPAHSALHKQGQEDWEKEHNHQHGVLEQEMAAWAGMVTEEKGDILLSSLPPCSSSGEQTPSMKELESQPFLVPLITMNNTLLITSYSSLQVLKVLCNGSKEEGSVNHSRMVSRGSSGLLGALPSCLLSTESWDRFKLFTLHFTEHHL